MSYKHPLVPTLWALPGLSVYSYHQSPACSKIPAQDSSPSPPLSFPQSLRWITRPFLLLRSQLWFMAPHWPQEELLVRHAPVSHHSLCPGLEIPVHVPLCCLRALPRYLCLAFDSWMSLHNSVWQDTDFPEASQKFLIHLYFWPTQQSLAISSPI